MRIVRSPVSHASICSIKVLPKVKNLVNLSFMLVLDLAETTARNKHIVADAFSFTHSRH